MMGTCRFQSGLLVGTLWLHSHMKAIIISILSIFIFTSHLSGFLGVLIDCRIFYCKCHPECFLLVPLFCGMHLL